MEYITIQLTQVQIDSLVNVSRDAIKAGATKRAFELEGAIKRLEEAQSSCRRVVSRG